MTERDRAHRLPLIFILITMMIDAMGVGLILPIMPALIRDVQGGTLAEAAVWGGILMTSFAVMQFLFGPTLGALSDRFGRRPILLISLAVMAADYLIMGVAQSIWLLLAARVVSGIAAATLAVGNAFVSDISRDEDKAARYGLVGAAFGMGFVLGPLLGGLLGEFGARAPFFAAAGLITLNLVFGALVLSETLPPEKRRPFRWARANPFGSFRAFSRLPGLRSLIVLVFVYQAAFNVYPAVWSYFTEARFGWSPGMIGLSLAAFGIAVALVQGAAIRPVMDRLGERGTVVFGIWYNAAAFLALAFVANGTLALILTPLLAIGAVVMPALRGVIARQVDDSEQGELQGVVSSAHSLSMVVSPLAMTWIFYAFTADSAPVYLPGAPFLLSMVMMLVALWVFRGAGAGPNRTG